MRSRLRGHSDREGDSTMHIPSVARWSRSNHNNMSVPQRVDGEHLILTSCLKHANCRARFGLIV